MSQFRRRLLMMMQQQKGADMIQGSFTPEEKTGTYTISLERPCSNFLFRKHTFEPNDYGYIGVLGADIFSADTGLIGVVMASNAAGTSWINIREMLDQIQISESVVNLNMSPYSLVPEQYDYIAW